jgi:vitamin B12 transporter
MTSLQDLRRGCAPTLCRSLLLCCAWGLLWAPASAARADEPRAEPIEQIVVTGSRRPRPLSEIGASVTVVDRVAIEREQLRDVSELLRDVPGFSLVRSGSRGAQTSVFARGGEADHNLVLVDGVQVNRGGGSFDLANLSVDGVERVEVVRGPASALYGSDAVASVIQVITRKGEGPMRGSVKALYGSDRTYELGASLRGGSDALGYSLNAGRYSTDGILSLNDDSDNTSYRGRIDLRPGDAWSIAWTSAYTDSSFDNPTDFVSGSRGGFPPVDPDQGRTSREWSTGVDIGWTMSDRIEHRVTLGYSDAKDRFFDALDAIPSDFSDSKSETDERRRTGEYRLLVDASFATDVKTFVTLGLEYEKQTFDDRSRDISAFGGARTRTRRSRDEDRTTRASYVQTDFTFLDQGFLTLGLRLDDNSKYGSVLNPLATLAWVLPSTRTRLHAAASRGFKEPTFVENFGFPNSAIGNPDLDPESSRSYEAGFDQPFLGGAGQISLTYFRTEFDDLISFVGGIGGAGLGTFENVQGVRSQGLEAEVRMALGHRVTVGGNYTRLRTRVRDSGGSGGGGFREGEALLRRPTHSGAFFVDYAGERLDLRVSGSVVGSREDLDFGTFPERRVKNDSYVKVDVGASYLIHTSARDTQTRLVIRAENALCDDYEEAFGFEASDFQILAGFELRF